MKVEENNNKIVDSFLTYNEDDTTINVQLNKDKLRNY